jgi:hypothetical protein
MGRNDAVADVDGGLAFAVASYGLSPCQRPRGGESIANGMSNCNAALSLELPSHLGCGDTWISFTITQQEDTSPPPPAQWVAPRTHGVQTPVVDASGRGNFYRDGVS